MKIDFSRMRVLNKSLKVRRLDDGRSKWIWYCMLSQKWKNYGHKVELPVLQWKKKLSGVLTLAGLPVNRMQKETTLQRVRP